MHTEDHGLKLVRLLDAGVEDAFKALTDPVQLRQWCAPRGFAVAEAEAGAAAGGRWRIRMVSPGGDPHTASGTVISVDPPKSLSHTFAWEGDSGRPGHESTVSVSLEDLRGRTLMTFRHSGLESAESRDSHEEGWCTALERLAELLSG